jgi:DNA ligase-1
MLAQRLKSATDMIEKMGEVSVEPKYDGLRVLIHFKKDKFIKAFTRNLNDVSPMFPELEKLFEATTSKELILDAEAVGLDETTKKLADFQTTMQRRRKHEISETAHKIPLIFNIFDILYKDSQSLIGEEYLVRRKILGDTIKENKVFKLTPYLLTSDPKVIVAEHKKQIDAGLEGIIVKRANSTYVPGRTGFRWVKMKEVEEATGKLSDTIDCVVMGFTSGQGKRISFGVGQFLAGVADGDNFKTITKVGTGLTDDQFKELSKRLKHLVVKDMPALYQVHKDLTPDFWVEPSVVVELAADDLTVSPKHTAGYAMRFPRLVKFRDDKSPKQATTIEEVKKLYKLQKST